MTENGTPQANLSPKQRRAIRALIETGDTAQAAQGAGVGRTTVYRWMTQPAFMAELKGAELQAIESLGRGMISLSDDVLAVWREAMIADGVPWTVKQQAANNVAGHILRYRELIDLEQRLSSLEEKIL